MEKRAKDYARPDPARIDAENTEALRWGRTRETKDKETGLHYATSATSTQVSEDTRKVIRSEKHSFLGHKEGTQLP